MTASTLNAFDLTGRVAIITGGAGLLGRRHAKAIASAGGIPVLLDVNPDALEAAAASLSPRAHTAVVDITSKDALETALAEVLSSHGRVDILINNAANNPQVERASTTNWSRFENYPLDVWADDLAVGLTGAMLSSQVFGAEMARRGSGVILNIASDLALIGPDQRIYSEDSVPEQDRQVKPVSYSVVKSALLGLTRYLATYWADRGVRVNAISPGGIYNGQDEAFVNRLSQLIPLGRMARVDEYEAAVLFLMSDASSYMTGSNLVIDGGRTCW